MYIIYVCVNEYDPSY